MKRLLPISIFVLFLSSYAIADTYIHGSIGDAEFDSGGSPDMYEIGLGFDLSRSLAIEFSYVNLGVVGSGLGGGDFIEEEADGFNTSLVLDLPINEMLSLYLSAGNLHWDDTARYFENGQHLDTYVVSGSDWNFGLGFKAEMFDGLDLKFGYTEYELDDIEVESISAGIVYRF